MLIKRKSVEAEANRLHKKPRSPKFAPITLSQSDGVLYLHFGTEWVQGAMRVRKPNALELEYSQQMMGWMLFNPQPKRIAQLGLGTGALTKFCRERFPEAHVTAVDLNPEVISVAHAMFKLPPADARLEITLADAWDWVNNPVRHGSLDILQVDLYDATARGPVLDTPEFYAACAACLAPDDIMTVNLFGDHPSFGKNIKAMQTVFPEVRALPEIHDGNVIAWAFKQRRHHDWDTLKSRAEAIKAADKLPAPQWVEGLRTACGEDA